MAVDHRAADIAMTHESFDFMQLTTATKQVRAKVMPDRMGGLAVETVSRQEQPELLGHRVRAVTVSSLRQE